MVRVRWGRLHWGGAHKADSTTRPRHDRPRTPAQAKKAEVDPLADPLTKRALAQGLPANPSPLSSSTGSRDDGAVSSKVEQANKAAPQTPLFKRRGVNKEERAAKLSHLASVASGKYPSGASAASRMLAGRAVYHSTTW